MVRPGRVGLAGRSLEPARLFQVSRILSCVNVPAELRSRITVTSGGCWLWYKTNSLGYAQAQVEGRSRFVHRIMYALFVGPIPPGRLVHHTCRDPGCVNPSHLRVVTDREHAAEHGNGAKTHCKYGHPFTPENTALVSYAFGIERRCRECANRRSRESYRRRRGLDVGTNEV